MKKFVRSCAVVVFLLCVYAFLVGTEVFAGKFSNEAIAFYFLAKGIFCSITMWLLVDILEMVKAFIERK